MSTIECSIISCQQSAPIYELGGVYGYGYTITNETFVVEQGNTYGQYYAGMIVFKTPPGTSFKNIITVNISGVNNSPDAELTINYALSSSDQNKSAYSYGCGKTVTDDEYQLCSGSFKMPYENQTQKVYSFTMNPSGINPETTYYLFMWLGGKSYPSGELYESWSARFDSTSLTIQTESSTKSIHILNGSEYIKCSAYIDNGAKYVVATPYIYVKKYYDWDGLFQGTVKGSLYLREGPGTSHSKITTMPELSVVTAYEVAVGENGDPWARVKYNSSEGWCSTRYLTYTAYARVINPNGARQYGFGTENTVEYSTVFPYGSEIIISTDNSGEDLAFRQEEDYDSTEVIIWCHTIHSEKNEDGSVSNMYGYVKLSDIELLSDRTVFEWRRAIG